MYTVQMPGFLFRRLNTNYTQRAARLSSVFRQYEKYKKFRIYRKKIGFWVREQSQQVMQIWSRQFECIFAFQIRRSIEILYFHTRIWNEIALKEFFKSWRRQIIKNSRYYLTSAAGVTMYNWDNERISDEEINRYKKEIDGIHRLRDSTVVCAKCQLRIIIDVTQPGVKYCKCHDVQATATCNQDPEGWQPFIEREDMLIWRREEPNSGGLYAYKVYGSFADVNAEDFLQVQIDVDYRKEWDPTARQLKIIDTDPESEASVNHSTDVVYWEMIWPRLFANRDYVYQRRWIIDKDKGLIVIISRVTKHPDAPIKPGIYRVATYWSYMVIKPYTEFHQPGIEFGLTYFDDPGVNIPSAVTAWVAMTGLPDFLIRMRQASKEYKKYKMVKQGASVPSTDCIPLDEYVSEQQVLDNNEERIEKPLKDEIAEEDSTTTEEDVLQFVESAQRESDIDEENRESTSSTTDEDQGLLHYFFLTRLFA